VKPLYKGGKEIISHNKDLLSDEAKGKLQRVDRVLKRYDETREIVKKNVVMPSEETE
jgi:hypothetical protein